MVGFVRVNLAPDGGVRKLYCNKRCKLVVSFVISISPLPAAWDAEVFFGDVSILASVLTARVLNRRNLLSSLQTYVQFKAYFLVVTICAAFTREKRTEIELCKENGNQPQLTINKIRNDRFEGLFTHTFREDNGPEIGQNQGCCLSRSERFRFTAHHALP